MKILELSGDTGSTFVITKALAAVWREQGHLVDVIAPVSRHLDLVLFFRLWRNKPDIIHAHLGNAAKQAKLFGRLLNIPVLVSLHGFQKAKHCKGLSHFTAVSQTIKAHYAQGGVPDERIQVVYNGIDPALAQPPAATFRQQLGLPDNAIVLGMMAAFTPMKQHDILLNAFAELLKTQPNAHLLLAGTGPLLEPRKTQIARLGLQEHVHLLGYTHEHAAFYHSLNLYVQSSRDEGFCMPLAEAMASGLPVIATASKGPEEYLRHDENAIIVREHHPQALAQAIDALLHHPEQMQRLAVAGKATVAHWSWPAIAADYMRVMQGVITTS